MNLPLQTSVVHCDWSLGEGLWAVEGTQGSTRDGGCTGTPTPEGAETPREPRSDHPYRGAVGVRSEQGPRQW